jgi:hypothetical protein
MRKELDDLLCQRYPLIFRDRNGDMRNTAMCWGFECGDGWFHLIDKLCKAIMFDFDYNQERLLHFYKMHMTENKSNWDNYKKDLYTKENLDIRIADVKEDLISVPVAMQVKEKFGGLRFYCTFPNSERNYEQIQNYISFAEFLSESTCEVCGSTEDAINYRMGWFRTLCKPHAIENYGEGEVDMYLLYRENYKKETITKQKENEEILSSLLK